LQQRKWTPRNLFLSILCRDGCGADSDIIRLT
jgi:hypothetical protein